MKLGVTGSRHGRPQRLEAKFFSFLAVEDVSEFHHGDCAGWDEQCYTIAKHYGIKTVAHPPDDDKFWAHTKSDIILPPKPYLDRNKEIVRAVDFLIAAPDGPEKQRSGTWSTVRYAKRQGVRGVVWT